MKTFNQLSVVASAAFVMFLSASPVAAQQGQGRGNIDPAEFRQRMMDNYRERLEIKGDDEWKAIQPLIAKVMDARRDVAVGGGGFGFGRGGGGRRGGGNNDAQANGNNQGGRRGFPGGEPGPEAEELQKAIDSNASKDELKAKLTKCREARKDKEAKLANAQEDLKEG